MKQMHAGSRHNLYLSSVVWGKLKERATIEESNSSEIIAYLLEVFLRSPNELVHLPRYQARLPDDSIDGRKERTVYVPSPLWHGVIQYCNQNQSSISALVEYLLRRYLGLGNLEITTPPLPHVIRQVAEQPATPPVKFVLGKDPFVYDPKQYREPQE